MMLATTLVLQITELTLQSLIIDRFVFHGFEDDEPIVEFYRRDTMEVELIDHFQIIVLLFIVAMKHDVFHAHEVG